MHNPACRGRIIENAKDKTNKQTNKQKKKRKENGWSMQNAFINYQSSSRIY